MGADLPPVLVLADHLGYAGAVPHGVTIYLSSVLPRLAAAGVRLRLCFLRGPHPAAAQLRAQGIDPVFFDVGKWDPTVAWRAAALARDCGARLLHATGVKGTLIARMAARLTGARTLLHVHDLNDPGAACSALSGWLAQPTDAAVCVSQAVRALAIGRYHVHPERVRVARNGVALETLRRARGERARMRAQLAIEGDRTVLAVIGRFHPVKGHRGLLSVWPVIARACPEALLLLIGDGPQREPCERLTRDLGLAAQVRFLGHRDDVAALLAAVDILLMPSASEGLGLAAVEALAVGRPVIAFAVGGLPEVIVDGVNGRLVAAGDDAAFARAVIETLRDLPQRLAYSQGAAASAQAFSLDAHVARLIDCYRMALAP